MPPRAPKRGGDYATNARQRSTMWMKTPAPAGTPSIKGDLEVDGSITSTGNVTAANVDTGMINGKNVVKVKTVETVPQTLAYPTQAQINADLTYIQYFSTNTYDFDNFNLRFPMTIIPAAPRFQLTPDLTINTAASSADVTSLRSSAESIYTANVIAATPITIQSLTDRNGFTFSNLPNTSNRTNDVKPMSNVTYNDNDIIMSNKYLATEDVSWSTASVMPSVASLGIYLPNLPAPPTPSNPPQPGDDNHKIPYVPIQNFIPARAGTAAAPPVGPQFQLPANTYAQVFDICSNTAPYSDGSNNQIQFTGGIMFPPGTVSLAPTPAVVVMTDHVVFQHSDPNHPFFNNTTAPAGHSILHREYPPVTIKYIHPDTTTNQSELLGANAPGGAADDVYSIIPRAGGETGRFTLSTDITNADPAAVATTPLTYGDLTSRPTGGQQFTGVQLTGVFKTFQDIMGGLTFQATTDAGNPTLGTLADGQLDQLASNALVELASNQGNLVSPSPYTSFRGQACAGVLLTPFPLQAPGNTDNFTTAQLGVIHYPLSTKYVRNTTDPPTGSIKIVSSEIIA